MSSLLNKLTGHHNSTDSTNNAHHDNLNNNHHHTATTAAHTNNNALNNTAATTTTQTTTTTTGTSPYGTYGTAAPITTGSNNLNNVSNAHTTHTATTGTTGYSHQGVATGTTGYAHHNTGAVVADDAITRSEEQLRIAKERVNTGKAELNKYVTTEHVEQAVPVTKERVVIEREPITEANRGQAMSGPAISEAHYETTINEDRVSATKETVPIERIRLAKQTETVMQNVGADLRKEHVDFTHSKLSNDNVNTATGNMTSNAGVPHTKY